MDEDSLQEYLALRSLDSIGTFGRVCVWLQGGAPASTSVGGREERRRDWQEHAAEACKTESVDESVRETLGESVDKRCVQVRGEQSEGSIRGTGCRVDEVSRGSEERGQ